MPSGHDKWMDRYNESLAAAQTALQQEMTARDAKTARLRELRLAAEAAAPAKPVAPAKAKAAPGKAKVASSKPPGPRKPAAKGKRPDELNASNDG